METSFLSAQNCRTAISSALPVDHRQPPAEPLSTPAATGKALLADRLLHQPFGPSRPPCPPAPNYRRHQPSPRRPRHFGTTDCSVSEFVSLLMTPLLRVCNRLMWTRTGSGMRCGVESCWGGWSHGGCSSLLSSSSSEL